MRRAILVLLVLATGVTTAKLLLVEDGTAAPPDPVTATRAEPPTPRRPIEFVPNLGQWDQPAAFVQRGGSTRMFLERSSWTVALIECAPSRSDDRGPQQHEPRPARGCAVRMEFVGASEDVRLVGERKLPGVHNYFLGDDRSRWRTGVPRFGSVLYSGLYPGIDVRLRDGGGVPEYDLLLQPGADLSRIIVAVEGARGLTIADDGSLVLETELGPLTQTRPKTWQIGPDGKQREVSCHFILLGDDRFGFEAPGWDGESDLVIDPGLIWSSFVGGRNWEQTSDMSVDDEGVVTVLAYSLSTDYPVSAGAYQRAHTIGAYDTVVSRLDPRRTGAAQLRFSTYLGGTKNNSPRFGAFNLPHALAVDRRGVVTIAGSTDATDFPTTSGAFDTTFNGGVAHDGFVSQLDPSKTGSAQLVYSTYFGGDDFDRIFALALDGRGRIAIAGDTQAKNMPTTRGAYDTTYNGGPPFAWGDGFISLLDPSKAGSAQLRYSAFLGGSGSDYCVGVSVDSAGVLTVSGHVASTNFPTTRGAYDSTFNGGPGRCPFDVFVARLDPSKTGTAQLRYSTYLGGKQCELVSAPAVDARGIITLTGSTESADFPTQAAYDAKLDGGNDAFVCRLDPSKTGTAQLVYSTFLGGKSYEGADALSVDADGIVTVVGLTGSSDFPTTPGAFDTTFNGVPPSFERDAVVFRLDPGRSGREQLVWSSFLGGRGADVATALAVDPAGVVTVAGNTASTDFPTTPGAFDTTQNGRGTPDIFATRLSAGAPFYADVYAAPIRTGGTQRLTLDAGKVHANRLYWIFGSASGTKPGVNLLGVRVPLNPDGYTDVAIGAVNTTVFANFRGVLDKDGTARASLNVPPNLPHAPGFTVHHAFVVYDSVNRIFTASNPVPLRLR